jgi:predicted site-specific integrase-resolvase
MKEKMLYSATALKTPADCRIVMDRLKKNGLETEYKSVLEQYCRLIGKENEDPSDPLVQDFYETLAAYERLLSEKNGRTTLASRTSEKIRNKGILQSLIEWTCGKVETNGFNLLLEHGLHKYTGEYLVVKYADRFSRDVVELASERLSKHGLELPSVGSGECIKPQHA